MQRSEIVRDPCLLGEIGRLVMCGDRLLDLGQHVSEYCAHIASDAAPCLPRRQQRS